MGALACISPLQTVLTILILTWLVAQFGNTALAGYGIGTRLEFLLIPIGFAIGVASVPLVGMAMGAGKVARARRATWIAAALASALLGALGLVVIALGGWALAAATAPSWTIFALVALGMAAYGVASVIAVRYANWGIDR